LAVAIRLTRVGATKRPAYRVIAIDKRRSRDGRALEILGFYDPLTEPATVQLDTDKIQAWIGKGAQPSDTVVKLMRQAEATAKGEVVETPKRAPRAAKPSKKAQAKAAAKAAAPEPAPAALVAEAAPEAAVEETPVEAAAEETPVEAAAEETPVEAAAEETPVDAAAEETPAEAAADAEKADA
jgi:small subunit ribosomal protein S16